MPTEPLFENTSPSPFPGRGGIFLALWRAGAAEASIRSNSCLLENEKVRRMVISRVPAFILLLRFLLARLVGAGEVTL